MILKVVCPKIKISILMHKQDDPTKCTAEKLIKFKMAKQVNKIPFGHIILDPFSKVILTNQDKQNLHGICAIDCSWNLAINTIKISKRPNINDRKLPASSCRKSYKLCKIRYIIHF